MTCRRNAFGLRTKSHRDRHGRDLPCPARAGREVKTAVQRIRVFGVVSLVAVGSATCAGTARGWLGSIPSVACGDIIGQAGPHDHGYRVVLGVMSVPPAYMTQGAVHVDGLGRWTYWHKAGIAVRSGGFTVTVTVPRVWRDRAAITWGNSQRIVSSLQFSGCETASVTKGWNGYAGGFYLRAPSACVPLVFSVGHRRATVRFGIGRTCG